MTTLQLNQEVLRQVGGISNDDNLLRKVIVYIKSITPTIKKPQNDKETMLQHILSLSKPCPLSEDEVNDEVEKGRQEFYDSTKPRNENNN